jgi:hypothetical protein
MKTKALLLSIPYILSSFLYAQDQEGGESAAEASVTGSASQPVLNPPDTSDSNPIVSMVRVGVPISAALEFSVADVVKLAKAINNGGSFNLADFVKAASIISSGGNITDITSALEKDIDLNDIESAFTKGLDLSELSGLSSSFTSLTENSNLRVAINSLLINEQYSNSDEASNLQSALTEAIKVADTLLADLVISSKDDLPTPVSVASLTSGYNYELVRLLAEYGAIGNKGSSLAGEILGTGFSGITTTGQLSTLAQDKSASSNYLSFLDDLTGLASFGEEDGKSTVLDIPLANVKLISGSDIKISDLIDVGDHLEPAPNSDPDGTNNRKDRKVLIIGAAKDMTVTENVTFQNANDAEDHALVLGAADEFKVDGFTITYEGSNLAIGAGGETKHADGHVDWSKSDEADLYLHNTTISTGGNLAAGTLGTLSVSKATFEVGTANSSTSDPDNVYLYANDLIQVNGLDFSSAGRLDDVYMEAITINLNEVNFPTGADVMLRSRSGELSFDSYTNPVVGAVNLTKVKHGDVTLDRGHFDGVAGHHDSSILLENGTPAIKIRKQYHK